MGYLNIVFVNIEGFERGFEDTVAAHIRYELEYLMVDFVDIVFVDTEILENGLEDTEEVDTG